MRVYVLGAGVSNAVGYPLGKELFDEIDKFIRSQNCSDPFDYRTWPEVCQWFDTNDNPLVSQAYRSRQLEHLFTALDHGVMLGLDDYQRRRNRLLWALEQYFQARHSDDSSNEASGLKKPSWDHIRSFGRKLCPGDVVVTFNYDSSLERVFLEQKKWSPRDGYGFEVLFQHARDDTKPIDFPSSGVKILHLHGALGWYFGADVSGEPCISLGPIFLRDLLESIGICAVDVRLRDDPPAEHTKLLHPSFLKTYSDPTFVPLWRQAGEALRAADGIVIIGYSLPEADSAALTLLLTNCAPEKVRIVNPNPFDNCRLNQLLSTNPTAPPQCLKDWLDQVPDCP